MLPFIEGEIERRPLADGSLRPDPSTVTVNDPLHGREANPQQAFERKLVFNAAAIPPRTQTVGRNPSFRKASQAEKPRKQRAIGA